MLIDTSFDVRTDARGRDPDTHSPTLRQYHRLLWSKPLPSGQVFHLTDKVPGVYLSHSSALGEFVLSSDSIVNSLTRWKSMAHICGQFSEEENEAFRRINSTIGATIIFPGNRIDGKSTINGARGFIRKIADRMDLTLESIRRHYSGEESPLGETLARYDDFFRLFENFEGYVDFFLLQDLVNENYNAVKFFLPFDDFNGPSVPQNLDAYRAYRHRSIEFVEARNCRIERQLLNTRT